MPISLPAYHFEGMIAVAEAHGFRQAYLDFPFAVPPGTGALRLRYSYTPTRVGGVSNLITLGLSDPHGYRGNGHRKLSNPEVFLSPASATPGFLPGPISPGTWTAQLAEQAVLASDPPCAYTLDIELLPGDEGAVNRLPKPDFAAIRSPRAGWYRGELHSHTLHSDGSLTTAELLDGARERGLDFLALTDHNTISALREIEQPARDSLLVIPGIELTTFYGHALVLGLDQWIDWRTGYQGWTMNAAARATHAAGGLFIIAHPKDIGSPVCTGCKWEYPDFDISLADGIEIWNGGWRGSNDKNPKNLDWWRELQNEPRRMVATAGSDFHGDLIGWKTAPVTWIYARNLSVAALLEGIRLGRVVLSNGPWLQVRAARDAQFQPEETGGTLVTALKRAWVSVDWDQVPPGAELALSNCQGTVLKKQVSDRGTLRQWVEINSSDRLWAELYAPDGDLLAFANPIFIKPSIE